MVTNHLANLGDKQLANLVIACLNFVDKLPEGGGMATGCHVGAHRAPTGAMVLMVLGGTTVDDAVAYSYLGGGGLGGSPPPWKTEGTLPAHPLAQSAPLVNKKKPQVLILNV